MLIIGMCQGKCKVNLRNPVTPERNKSAPRPVELYQLSIAAKQMTSKLRGLKQTLTMSQFCGLEM